MTENISNSGGAYSTPDDGIYTETGCVPCPMARMSSSGVLCKGAKPKMQPLGLSKMQIKTGNSVFRPPILPFKEGQGLSVGPVSNPNGSSHKQFEM